MRLHSTPGAAPAASGTTVHGVRHTRALCLPGVAPPWRARAADAPVCATACLRAGLPDESWPADVQARTTREDNMQQLLGDYDQLVSDASVDPARVGVLGFSYGGYAAALLTSLRPVGFMVLRSPAIYPDDEWRTPKQLLDQNAVDAVRQHRLAPGENLVLDCCCRFAAPYC